MTFLLDTHIWLWSLLEPAKLKQKMIEVLQDPKSDKSSLDRYVKSIRSRRWFFLLYDLVIFLEKTQRRGGAERRREKSRNKLLKIILSMRLCLSAPLRLCVKKYEYNGS
jgi:hypothetical protein